MPNRSASAHNLSGMWLWHTALIASTASDILDFAAAHAVNAIFLQASSRVPYSDYASFIERARGHGIDVEAVNGDPAWALPSGSASVRAFVDWVEAYHQASRPLERFTGLHLDLEPYTLPEWQTDRAALIRGWANAVKTFSQAAQDIGLAGTLDVPFWLNTLTLPDSEQPLGSWMVRQVSRIAVMAYRTSALGRGGIVSIATPLLHAAQDAHRQAVVAVDTSPTNPPPGSVQTSFYGLSQRVLDQQLSLVDEALSNEPGYAGHAVNAYEDWPTLPT